MSSSMPSSYKCFIDGLPLKFLCARRMNAWITAFNMIVDKGFGWNQRVE